jgi:hypothetical protein
MSRLYVLTHEIIELEDYEQVPSEGTEIVIVGEAGLIAPKQLTERFNATYDANARRRGQYTDEDVKEVQRGLYPPQADTGGGK